MSSFLIPSILELTEKVEFELGTRDRFLTIKKLILKKQMPLVLHHYCNEFHQKFTPVLYTIAIHHLCCIACSIPIANVPLCCCHRHKCCNATTITNIQDCHLVNSFQLNTFWKIKLSHGNASSPFIYSETSSSSTSESNLAPLFELQLKFHNFICYCLE